jgi:hypothetical protein
MHGQQSPPAQVFMDTSHACNQTAKPKPAESPAFRIQNAMLAGLIYEMQECSGPPICKNMKLSRTFHRPPVLQSKESA